MRILGKDGNGGFYTLDFRVFRYSVALELISVQLTTLLIFHHARSAYLLIHSTGISEERDCNPDY